MGNTSVKVFKEGWLEALRVASMSNLVGRWIFPPMHLGQARSAEPPVRPLTLIGIGPSNSPETGPTAGGSPERAEMAIIRRTVSEIGCWYF